MALQEELEKQGNYLFKYRGTLPIIILVGGLIFYAYEIGIANLAPTEAYKFIGLAISLFGLLIRIITIGNVAKNTSGRNTERQIADVVNTKGIYSTVRHPLYVGNFFMWLGIAVITESLWFVAAFVFMYWVYYERIMFAEEQFLRRKFQDNYLNWAAKTPAFIPCLKKWKKNENASFNLRKVLRQEKNGFMAIFVIINLFELIEKLILEQTYKPLESYWFYASIAAIVIYLLLKVMKRNVLADKD